MEILYLTLYNIYSYKIYVNSILNNYNVTNLRKVFEIV